MTVVANPAPTVDWDGRGFPAEAIDTGFFHWLFCSSLKGDDGKQYWVVCDPMSLAYEKLDLWLLGVSHEKGKVYQDPESIFKIADFPLDTPGRHVFPGGTLKIKKTETEVTASMEDGFSVTCKDGKTWRYVVDEKETGLKVDLVHHGAGLPLWYGQDKPLPLTPHCEAYGYNWSGRVDGTITIDGRQVKVEGSGIRERWSGISQSPAEVGGWEDWGWFHFDEIFGSFWRMKYANTQDLAINIVDGNQYFPVGKLKAEHHDWAFHPRLGAFIPTFYKYIFEIEAGVVEISANAIGTALWGKRNELPDYPLITVHWEKINGTFTDKDGRKKTLTNGTGGVVNRITKQYPSLIPPRIISAEAGFDSEVNALD